MTLTQIRLVSLYIKFAPVTMTDIFILVLISISSALVTVDSHLSTSNDLSPSYTTYPEDDIGGVVSPYSDSSSNSSRESSPPSPGPKTPPNEDLSAPSRQARPHRLYQPLGHRNEAR